MAGGHTSETVDAAISHPVISQVDRSKGKSSRPGEEPRAWRTASGPRENDRITLGTVSGAALEPAAALQVGGQTCGGTR